MRKKDAIKYFGSQAALARALAIRSPSIAKWAEVPGLRQLQLERITNGALKADPSCYGPIEQEPQERNAA